MISADERILTKANTISQFKKILRELGIEKFFSIIKGYMRKSIANMMLQRTLHWCRFRKITCQ